MRDGVVPTIGAFFRNTGTTPITSLTFSYKGEEWRLGTASRADRLDFQYSAGAIGLTAGTWTDFDALDFSTPNTSASLGAIDGNANGNFTNISATISGLSIAANATFGIRWSDFDATGPDDGLAVDDFTASVAVPEAPEAWFGAMICGVVGLAFGGRSLWRKKA